MAKKKGYSDGYLLTKWREAGKAKYGNYCMMCGSPGPLECHHIIKSRHRITRHDVRNCAPLCVECHKKAHTKSGDIWLYKNHPDFHEIVNFDTIMFKEYLRQKGISRKEFEERTMKTLKEVIDSVV